MAAFDHRPAADISDADLAALIGELNDDPRVSGTGTYRLSVDASGSLGFTQGTLQLDVPGGAWAGTCTGSSWNDLGAGDLSCWLVGSGRYAGLTFYLNHRFAGGSDPDQLLGTIIPGEPPSP